VLEERRVGISAGLRMSRADYWRIRWPRRFQSIWILMRVVRATPRNAHLL
jgi:hypothetical protein